MITGVNTKKEREIISKEITLPFIFVHFETDTHTISLQRDDEIVSSRSTVSSFDNRNSSIRAGVDVNLKLHILQASFSCFNISINSVMNLPNDQFEGNNPFDEVQMPAVPQNTNNGSSRRPVMHIDKIYSNTTLSLDRTELTVNLISSSGRLVLDGRGMRVVVHRLEGIVEIRGDDCDVCIKYVDGGSVVVNKGGPSDELRRFCEAEMPEEQKKLAEKNKVEEPRRLELRKREIQMKIEAINGEKQMINEAKEARNRESTIEKNRIVETEIRKPSEISETRIRENEIKVVEELEIEERKKEEKLIEELYIESVLAEIQRYETLDMEITNFITSINGIVKSRHGKHIPI